MFSKKVKFLESQIPRRIKLVEMNIDTQVNRLQDFYSGGSRGRARKAWALLILGQKKGKTTKLPPLAQGLDLSLNIKY